MKKYDVFLSYSKKDKAWARRLAERLKVQGVKVWVDEEKLKEGEDPTKAIRDAIAKSEVVVSVLDPKAAATPKVLFESGAAVGLGKELRFVVSEAHLKSGRSPLDADSGKLLLRKSPSATAKELIRIKGWKPPV